MPQPSDPADPPPPPESPPPPPEGRVERVEATIMRWLALLAALGCGVLAVRALVAKPGNPHRVPLPHVAEWCRASAPASAPSRPDAAPSSTMSSLQARKESQVPLITQELTPKLISKLLLSLELDAERTQLVEKAISGLLTIDEARREALGEYITKSEELHLEHARNRRDLHRAKVQLEHAQLDREVACVKSMAEVQATSDQFIHRHRLEVVAAFFGLALQALAVLFLLRRGPIARLLDTKPAGPTASSTTMTMLARDLGPGVVLAMLGTWMLALTLLDDAPDPPPVSAPLDSSAPPGTDPSPE